MSAEVAVERFEPVYLTPEKVALTEYGKRWFDRRLPAVEKFWAVARDVMDLGRVERLRWPSILRQLELEGVPVAMASGLSQYAMQKNVDHNTGKTAFTMPATVAMALGTAAPTSTTTGVWGSTETTNYTNYVRRVITPASEMGAASAATPSVALNSATLTFAGAGATPATELGFLITDNSTTNTGNAIWFGSLTSVTISSTQTPPTVAIGALSLSINST